MKIVSVLMALFFVYASAMQYNDPDTLIWIAVYGTAGVFSILAVFSKPIKWPAIILAVITIIWCATLAIRVIGQQPLYDSEEGREMMGLAIVSVWCIILAMRSRPT